MHTPDNTQKKKENGWTNGSPRVPLINYYNSVYNSWRYSQVKRTVCSSPILTEKIRPSNTLLLLGVHDIWMPMNHLICKSVGIELAEDEKLIVDDDARREKQE